MVLRKRNRQPKKQTTRNNSAKQATTQTFMDHVHELRSRLLWVVGTLIAASIVAYQFHDLLINIVTTPLHGNKLIYLSPGGGLAFVFTVCLYFGALFTIPVAIYHLYKFLQPVLKEQSRRLVFGIVTVSILLSVLGIVFGYLLVIPGAIHFLGEFSGGAVVPTLTTDAYLNFVVLHLFGMALLFQLPLLLFIADHVRPLPPGGLLRLQRWVIAGSVIAAAIISPTPDPINLGLVALPIIGIYELGVVIVWLRRRSYHAKKTQVVEQAVARESGHVSPADVPVTQTPPTAIKMRPSTTRSVDGFAPRKRIGSEVTVRPERRKVNAAINNPQNVSLDGIL